MFDHICREAGKEILDVNDAQIHGQSKDDRSPLTMKDRRSHELISRRLNKVTISGQVLPVLSEEGKGLSYVTGDFFAVRISVLDYPLLK